MNTEKAVEAIEALIRKAEKEPDPGDAMKYTQAALNAAHAVVMVHQNLPEAEH